MANKQSKLETKLNTFSRVTFLDENGRPKSSAWLYSFLLGLLFVLFYVVVYIGSGVLLAKVFHSDSFAILLLQYLLTALIGSIPGLLFSIFLKKEHKALPYYAYFWILVLTLLSVVAALMMSDWKNGYGWLDMWLFCVIVFFPAMLCMVTGGLITRSFWKKELAAMRAIQEKAKSRPSYYNT